jgi:hypothetical protein
MLKRIWFKWLMCTLAVSLRIGSSHAGPAAQALDQPLAHATAFNATIFGYPLNGMYERLTREVLDPATRKAGFDEYFHFRQLATPDVAPFPAPNNDTLYSTAWVDLRREPAILATPDTGGRYYTAQILDMATETIANVGQSVDGTQAGKFALVGPGWTGELPDGLRRVIRCDTAFAYVLLRIVVGGADDVAAVNALQDKFTIASVTRFGHGETGAVDDDPPPRYQAGTPAEWLAMLDRVLRMSPVRTEDKGMVASFATIGVGPEASSLHVTPSSQTLASAEREARAVISSVGLRTGKILHGWRMPPQAIGRYGVDYLQRASVWDGGPLANTPDESFYPTAVLDADGKPLDGATGRYVLRFPPGELPPVNAFWSLTMYRLSDGHLVANPIHRYSIGDRTPGLIRAPDGLLTLSIQADRPIGEAANWLPAPKARFYMVLRLYGSKPAARNGAWVPPPVDRLP